MAKISETGHAINVANFESLISFVTSYGIVYNPSKTSILLPALSAKQTRASLMTGLYPHEAGVGHMTGAGMGPGYLGHLNDSCVTIAEVVGQAGYYTGMVGKWHAGNIRESWPENRGFQNFWGIHNYIDSYFKVLNDCEVFENRKIVIAENTYPTLGAEDGTEWYTTDVFTNKAMESIDRAVHQGKPFFSVFGIQFASLAA